jgi:uroporphyrinogen-III synthase
MITFMSPSAFRNFYDLLPETFDFRRIRAAAFGKTTFKAIEEKGLMQVISIEKSNIENFVNQIITHTF